LDLGELLAQVVVEEQVVVVVVQLGALTENGRGGDKPGEWESQRDSPSRTHQMSLFNWGGTELRNSLDDWHRPDTRDPLGPETKAGEAETEELHSSASTLLLVAVCSTQSRAKLPNLLDGKHGWLVGRVD